MKKIFALLLSVVMLVTLCACGSSNEDKKPPENTAEPTPGNTEEPAAPGEVKMTDGYYYLDITGLNNFVHFNEDGTYYALYFNGNVTEAGQWELVDEAMEYVTPGPDGDVTQVDDNGTANASQVVIFTNYATGVPVKVAFAEDALQDMSLGGMANHRTLVHVPDYPYNPSTDEIAIQIFLFYANNDIGSNLILNHDKTFEDLTGDAYESGTWELTGAGEYTLNYDAGKGSLKVAENGKTAVLTLPDGSTVEVKDDYHDDVPVAKQMSLTAEDVEVEGLPMKVALRLDGYSDGTCQLYVVISQIGAELLADEGTYEVSGTMRPTFHMSKAGDFDGEPDYGNASENGIPFNVHYVGNVEPEFNGAATPMALDATLSGIYNPNATAEEVKVVATMTEEGAQVGLPMGVDLRTECYSDGTAKVIVFIGFGVDQDFELDSGTYEISPAMKFTFHFENAGDVEGVPDYASASDSGVDIDVHYTGSATISFGGADTPLTIDSTMRGTYSQEV